MKQSKIVTLLIGGVIGAALGVLIAFFFHKQVQQNDNQLTITPRQGVKVGMGFVNLIRSIFDLGKLN
jgi:hypothetical protein